MNKYLHDFLNDDKNLELLNSGQIDTLLQKCAVDHRPELIKMLADSNINLTDSGDKMYGIQTAQTKNIFKDTYKITVGSPDRNSNPLAYGINSTRSDGVRGGGLVAFKSLSDAYSFIKNYLKSGEYSPYQLSSQSASKYTWVEVPYRGDPNVKFWITQKIADEYDPVKKVQERTKYKAIQEYRAKVDAEVNSLISEDKLKDLIENYLEQFNEQNKCTSITMMWIGANDELIIWGRIDALDMPESELNSLDLFVRDELNKMLPKADFAVIDTTINNLGSPNAADYAFRFNFKLQNAIQIIRPIQQRVKAQVEAKYSTSAFPIDLEAAYAHFFL